MIPTNPKLKQLDASVTHPFIKPVKRINEGEDVATFHVSKAYRDIMIFLTQLNRAVFPRKTPLKSVATSVTISKLQDLIKDIIELVDRIPLDPGTQRYGNTAFRKWFELLDEESKPLLEKHLPESIMNLPHQGDVTALEELQAYLLGSFGSAQRIDYGTGHELSFLAFLGGIWKLGGFGDSSDGSVEGDIVIKVIQPYLDLIRKLILKYNLEPAGTHGVWGLDDHSFLPYIFGSAQYGPEITDTDPTPVEGSGQGVPKPGDIMKAAVVERERKSNLYFAGIGFINDVKTGPFWEHSPTLFDISGVSAGWAKINKGMLKMFDAEVLGKFPVVQHFPFGFLYSFEADPESKRPVRTTHIASQPKIESKSRVDSGGIASTAAPWAAGSSDSKGVPQTAAPWARSGPGNGLPKR